MTTEIVMSHAAARPMGLERSVALNVVIVRSQGA